MRSIKSQTFSFLLFFLIIKQTFSYIYCRVSIFGPSPLQWICREWVQKLGSDEATTCFGGKKHAESSGPTSQGEGTPRPRTGTPNSSCTPRAPSLFLGLLLPLPPFPLWDICCYIFFSSVHLPPTLVNHPCLSSSARPIGYSFWCSVSYCGPHRPVQGSHPH